MKKNVASQVIGAQMVTASDGSAFTGTVSCAVTVDGGTQSAGGGTVTHEGNGFHSYTPTQAETNGDHVAFTFTGAGAVPVTVQVYTTFPQSADGLDAAGIRSAIGLSAANLDGQLTTIDAVVDDTNADTASIITKVDTNYATLLGIIADTAEIGTAGAGLTAVPWNAAWDAEVQSEVADALAAYDPPTKAELDSGLAGLNDLTAAQVNAEVDAAIETYHLDHLFAVDYDPATPPGTATALLNELIESDAGVARFTANALEQAPSGGGGGGDATEANQTTIIGHLTDIKGGTFSGSTDSLEAIRDRGDAAWSTASGFATTAEIATVDANIDAILVDTGSTLPAQITALNNISAADVNAEVDTAIADASLATASSIAALNDFDPASDRVLLDKTDAMRIATAVNDASATTTSFVTDLTEATDDHYIGRTVIFTSGALLGQATDITDYNGTTKALTVTALTEAPADNDTFEIV